MSQSSEMEDICGKKLSFRKIVNNYSYFTQLRGELFSPSEKYSNYIVFFICHGYLRSPHKKSGGFQCLKNQIFSSKFI